MFILFIYLFIYLFINLSIHSWGNSFAYMYTISGKWYTNQRENVCIYFCTKGETRLHNSVTLQHLTKLQEYQGTLPHGTFTP